MGVTALQTALRLIYPPRCTICGEQVESDFGLCGPCWRDTQFISGLCCDLCGAPLPGESAEDNESCDDCLTTARPWNKGRSALLYKDNGRKLVLALKHGDRQDVARPSALWMARVAQPMLKRDMIIAPVPLHWSRMLKRRYNQAALLAQAVAREARLPHCPDLLIRSKRTKSLDGVGFEARHQMLADAIRCHPKRDRYVNGRRILLIDDVMTSGATLSASAQACVTAGALEVCILTLARVVKDA